MSSDLSFTIHRGKHEVAVDEDYNVDDDDNVHDDDENAYFTYLFRYSDSD